MIPFGPVKFVDTAGYDDSGAVGELRVKKSKKIMSAADIVLIVSKPSEFCDKDMDVIKSRPNSSIIVFTCNDYCEQKNYRLEENSAIDMDLINKKNIPFYRVSNKTGQGINQTKEMLIEYLEEIQDEEKPLLFDIIEPDTFAMLICPIDLEAPKGRLILPQVQTIREILDYNSGTMVIKDNQIKWALDLYKKVPDIAITDSQVVLKASKEIPEEIPLTTFSILYSRWKGDLDKFVQGVKKIDKLQNGDKVLISESCSHHDNEDDIGRVKIPKWLKQYTKKQLQIDVVAGGFPENFMDYDLIIHCGACMLTRKKMLAKIEECEKNDIEITNYGLVISYVHGVLDRVLKPFYSM